MKWTLIVVWITIGTGSGIEVHDYPTLEECFSVGERATNQFQQMYGPNSASFSCAPSHGREPSCGSTGQESCAE